ncbi:MAG: TatD family hydrolase [Nanoarchaeota archaeon]
MFIDIHSHLEIVKNLEKSIENSRKNNVKIILTAGTNQKTNRLSLEFAKKYPEVYSCLGLYPTDALKLSEEEIKKEIQFIKEEFKKNQKIIAIGEIGLDLKESSRETLEKQKQNFSKMIKLAIELDIPIIVHARKAELQAIEVIENLTKNTNYKKIIMHCFMGNFKLIKRIIKNNWFLTAPTNIKNSQHFQDLVKITPIEQLFCETDSPFLHPNKEKNNIPGNVLESYKKVAEIKGLELKQTEDYIENNYKKVFKR